MPRQVAALRMPGQVAPLRVRGGRSMADVGQRHVQQHPDVCVSQPVVRHPAGSAYLDDPVRAQQPQVMGDRRLARLPDRGQITDAHLAFQQGDQNPEPAWIGEQPEHVSQLSDLG
jgi:hypothetical protein